MRNKKVIIIFGVLIVLGVAFYLLLKMRSSKSNGEIIIIQDADLEYNPADFPKLIDPIIRKKSLVVYGTRLKNYPVRLTGRRRTPLLTHYIGNKFLSLLTGFIYKSQSLVKQNLRFKPYGKGG